jgi:RNA-directed DNA polymerase
MAVMKQIAERNDRYTQQTEAASSLTGAPSHPDDAWHAIDWRKVHQEVRRLQARIVKAVQENRWSKVKALQHLLTHSFSGRALAVRRVTENQGKWTPGVDGEIWDTPQKKAQAIRRLRQHGYRAQPLRRVYIDKSSGNGQRPLGIPCMIDRAFQMLYKFALDPIAETTGDPNSYGFRLGRSTADAIGQCFLNLCRKTSATWILEADLKACFDTISHQWLLDNIPIDKRMLTQWLKSGVIDRHVFQPTEAGAPQGSPISPVIANLTLDGMEGFLKENLPQKTVEGKSLKVNLTRFADDFIVTGSIHETLAQQVIPLLEQFLGERDLALSPEKTRITYIEQGFDFLGQNIRKYKGKLLIKPSRKSIKAFLNKVRATIKANKQATTGDLINQLNPIIRGWALYHRHVVSKKVFSRVDSELFIALWRWAKRRHRNKSRAWIMKKYFRPTPNHKWQFFGQSSDKDGKPVTICLTHAARIPIRRHVKVKGQANPYDPQWETYFEKRLDVKMGDKLWGKQQLLSLWRSQQGVCPVCQQKITETTGWARHHIIWRCHGGGDTLDNLVLLHPNCHRQVHSRNLSVVKPRPSPGVRKA